MPVRAVILCLLALSLPTTILLSSRGLHNRIVEIHDPDLRTEYSVPFQHLAIDLKRLTPIAEPKGLFTLKLFSSDAPRLCDGSSVTVRVGTHFKIASLQTVILSNGNPACEFRSGPMTLQDNELLTLVSGKAEQSIKSSQNESPHFTLEVKATNIEHLSIWGVTGAWPQSLLQAADEQGNFIALRGHVSPSTAPAARMTRFELLQHMWNLEAQPWILPLVLAFGLSLIAFGLKGLSLRLRPIDSPSGRWHVSIAVAALFFGLTSLYAVITPPFQGPDEPDHFLSYANLLGRPDLVSGALELANKGHFERIKFRPAERFTEVDASSPREGGWAEHVVAPNAIERSPLALVFVKPWSSILKTMNASQSLFFIRLTNALYASVCIFIGMIVLQYGRAKSYFRFASLIPLFIVPTLPFFAMHVSNFAWLTALYALLLLCISVLIADDGKTFAAHLLTGLTVTLLILGGVSGFSTAFFVAVLLLSLAIPRGLAHTRNSDGTSQIVSVGQQLISLSLVFIPVLLLLELAKDTAIFAVTWQRITSLISKVLPHADISPNMLLLNGALAYLFIYGALFCMANRSSLVRRAFQLLERRTASYILIAGFLAVIIAGVLRSTEPLFNIESTGVMISPLDYGIVVCKKFLAALALGKPEFYLSHSFWAGLGWLETTLPVWITVCLRSLALLGLVAVPLSSLIRATATPAEEQRGSLNLRLILVLISLAAFLVSLALGSAGSSINLHGRYMIGFYLAYLAVAFWGFSGLVGSVSGSESLVKRVVQTVAVGIPIVVHNLTLCFIVLRFL